MTDDTPDDETTDVQADENFPPTREDQAFIDVRVPVDDYRAGMFEELCEMFGEEEARGMVGANLDANSAITMLYDQRERVANARQQMAANPADEPDEDTEDADDE